MADAVLIRQLNKQFASLDAPDQPVHAVRDVNLEVKPGELVTLLGPSGCGKTTLLRMIAGFEEPTSGDIVFGDRRMNDVAPNHRDAAMVFQSYAIFPHLSVYENVVFGLRLKRLSRPELEARAQHILEMTGLGTLAQRSPNQLSGGQQQRVALARAIVMEPRVLLFDEPLSNLDAKLRDQMRVEIRELQQRLGITALYVTHDQIEAMSISDRIVVMNGGIVEQVGTPREVYARPASRFVADFIGKANFVSGKKTAGNAIEIAGKSFDLASGNAQSAGDAVTVVIRPEAIKIAADAGDFPATVRRAMFLGNIAEYLVEVDGVGSWLVDSPNPGEAGLFEPGTNVFVSPSRAAIHAV
ncbi:ABC transporter ATP-binding protein [Mesorhizobium sp. CAU 1732]|uniref:ABC transporter ATP-binding protein n=1 Tax=Mesorhizobium sp. CAU 1732 TaxID=3140358 RepID=UPI00326061E0